MEAAPTTFWGKLDGEGDARTWHPLVAHCADVAACCEALLQRTLLGRRLARSGDLDELSPVRIARLSFLAALHDLGKFNHGFQDKAFGPSTTGHTREILGVLGGDSAVSERLWSALPGTAMEAWGEECAATRLLVAAICHHGRPYKCERPEGDLRVLWAQTGRFGDPIAGIRALVADATPWFPDAFTVGDPLPANAAFQHFFAGLVMLADWIGSDRTQFPFASSLADRMAFARERAQRALRAMGLDVAAVRPTLPRRDDALRRLLPPRCAARPLQRAVLELEASASAGSLVILEAETGSGKTEAALVRFVELLRAGAVDGMYFALPTRTAATQIHGRVVRAVAEVFSAGTQPPVTLAVPGYLRVDEVTGTRLPGFRVLWTDVPGAWNRHRTWAAEHPKRYLAGAISVGTIDQVLLSTLITSHAHMRATSLSRQLLVVDEVHASDVYMTNLLEEVLRHHLRLGGHAMLMSATLGASAHARLCSACGVRVVVPSIDLAAERPYPMLTYACADVSTPTTTPIGDTGRSRSIAVELLSISSEPDAIAAQALDAAAAGARVLVIRNTVGDCVRTQFALEALAQARGSEVLFRCEGTIAPHHSRYAAEDRVLLDAVIEAEYGGGVRDPKSGKVVVATQTVEQSLDIDADVMLTDLCPIDVLLQRLGRLHRHERTRPSGFEAPRVIVLVPSARALDTWIDGEGLGRGPAGLGTVYEDLRILELTWRLLEGRGCLEIPAENRALVELGTHPDALARLAGSEGVGAKWRQHGLTLLGEDLADRGRARAVLIPRDKLFGDVQFPDPEKLGRVTTRLGADDRVVTLADSPLGPFGKPVKRLTLLARWMAGVVVPDEPIAVDTSAGGVLRFDLGAAEFVYDRLGLRRR